MFTYSAFNGHQKLFSGSAETVALEVKRFAKKHPQATILIFSDSTGRQVDWDLSGSEQEILERLKIFSSPAVDPSSRVGRPKLGVIAREISLLPIHWEWLSNQDGGASSVIRKLIDDKIKTASKPSEKTKQVQETTYKFLSALAGNLPNYENAIRYLYRKDKKLFFENMSGWPKDIVRHAKELSTAVFE